MNEATFEDVVRFLAWTWREDPPLIPAFVVMVYCSYVSALSYPGGGAVLALPLVLFLVKFRAWSKSQHIKTRRGQGARESRLRDDWVD